VVTFVEVAPEGGGPDDEPLHGERIGRPAWLTRARYLALVAVIVGAPAAGYVYSDRGHCPLTVSCEVLDQARPDLRGSYYDLFPDAQTIASSVWYAPATDTVYYQELDGTGASGETIILTQQRLSGPDIPFGPTLDRTLKPPHHVLVTARRGPWLVTAALYSSRGGLLPIMAALRWVASSPLPG